MSQSHDASDHLPAHGPDDPRPFAFAEGEILAVDKPRGWTSFDVVNKLRYAIKYAVGKRMKVGHAGTLDPLATGLLLIGTGKRTRVLESLQAQEKEYTGTLRFGETTASYDGETAPEQLTSVAHLDLSSIQTAAQKFTGRIDQRPPAFSAVRVDGKRAYKLARQGKAVQPEARSVTVASFDIQTWRSPEADFLVRCSKGTYIRSLAHDLGQELAVGAWLSQLRRTAIGLYRIEEAWDLERLLEVIRQQVPPPVEPGTDVPNS